MKVLLSLILLFSFSVKAELTTNVDRTKLKINQNLHLKITSDNSNGRSPSLTNLKRSFNIIGSSKVSRPYVVQSQVKHKTMWLYILQPKRSGNLSIPRLSVNGESSRPINVTVSASNRTKKPNNQSKRAATIAKKSLAHDILVSAKVNKKKLYPNEILIYKLSINYSEKATATFEVSPPFVNGAVTMALTEPSFEEITQRSKPRIIRHQSFAIFADQVALYDIEPATISFDYQVQGGALQKVKLQANRLRFEIAPAANQTNLGYWIPSSDVKLTQRWLNPQDGPFSVGVPIKRIIEITARGVNAETLPLISPLTHQKMQIKLEDVTVENTVIDGQLVGTRRELVSMTPKSAGKINLPPTDIHWWNTQTDQAQFASLMSQNLTVIPASKNPIQPIKAPSVANEKQPIGPNEQRETLASRPSLAVVSEQKSNWIIAILFFLLVATTSGWLISSRKRRKH